jgi:hypothetical protein
MCLAGREPAEHVRDGDPHVANARTAAALTGLDRNDVLIIHGANLASFWRERSSVPPGVSVAHDMSGLCSTRSVR